MKTALITLAALALTACVGAPVTQNTLTACASLPLARLAVDIAIARGERPMTAQDKADLASIRAAEDARCAQAAAASAPK